MSLRGVFYRLVMRLAHRFHWHYAPPIYPEGDTQLWCKWCGFRQTIKRKGDHMSRADVLAGVKAALEAAAHEIRCIGDLHLSEYVETMDPAAIAAGVPESFWNDALASGEYAELQSEANLLALRALRTEPEAFSEEFRRFAKAWAWLAKEELLATQRNDSLHEELDTLRARVAKLEAKYEPRLL